MRMLITAALPLALATWATAAHATDIGSAGAACRAKPSTRAAVIERLAPHAEVAVEGAIARWTKVRTEAANTCWIPSTATTDIYVRPLIATTVAPRATKAVTRNSTRTATRPRRATASRTRSRGFAGGTCPCGSGRVCIGPRGGRYCITSGGNKRYGV